MATDFPTPTGGNTTAPIGVTTYSQPGYFIVSEGELGNIVNMVAKAGQAIGKVSISVTDLARGDVWGFISNGLAAATMKTTGQKTIKFVKDPVVATVLVNEGYTDYPSKSAAQGAAKAQNNNSASAAPFGGLQAIGDFFNKLEQANTWLRIAEAALAIAIIGVSLGKLTGADNYVMQAVGVAAKVVK